MYQNVYETGKFLTQYKLDFAFNFLYSLSGVLNMKNCKMKFSTWKVSIMVARQIGLIRGLFK